jgi:hypothetical protein
MEQTSGGVIAICLAVVIGLGVPAMLYAGMRRGGTIGQIELIKRAGNRAGKPWKAEDDQLAELSRRVEKLKKK